MDENSNSPAPPAAPAAGLERLTSAEHADSASLRQVLLYSVLGGLCPLIPLPFIDDVLTRSFRRRMVGAVLRHAGFEPTDAQVQRLTRTENRGLLLGCLIGVVWYAFKKISRKILYFFAIKDCVDVTSRLLHEGWLVQYALSRGVFPPGDLSDEQLDHLHGAIDRTLRRVDTRPLEQLLRRLFGAQIALLTKAADGLGQLLKAEGASRRDRDAIERALDSDKVRQVGAIEGLLDSLVRALGAERSYLRQVEQTFDDEVDGELSRKTIPAGEGG